MRLDTHSNAVKFSIAYLDLKDSYSEHSRWCLPSRIDLICRSWHSDAAALGHPLFTSLEYSPHLNNIT